MKLLPLLAGISVHFHNGWQRLGFAAFVVFLAFVLVVILLLSGVKGK